MGKMNIYNMPYKNMSDVFSQAKRRERDDLDSKSFAENRMNKMIDMLRKDDFRDGKINVKIHSGYSFVGKLNAKFLGKEGREHEATMKDENVLIKKGSNDVTFTLKLQGQYKITTKDGKVDTITGDEAKKIAKDLTDEVEKRTKVAKTKSFKKAADLGLMKYESAEEIRERMLEEGHPDQRIDEAIEKAWEDQDAEFSNLAEQGLIKEEDPDYTKLKPFITENGDVVEPIYDLGIEVNGVNVITRAEGSGLDAKEFTEDVIMQLEGVGKYAGTVLDQGANFLVEQGVRGAAFRASGTVGRAASSAVKAPMKDVQNGNNIIGSALSKALAILSRGTQMR